MYWVFQELFKVRNKIEKNEKHSENISLDAFLVQKTEENVMNKEEFLNYIIDFAVDTLWDDLKRREQLRALFTSWCFIFGIDADTKECDIDHYIGYDVIDNNTGTLYFPYYSNDNNLNNLVLQQITEKIIRIFDELSNQNIIAI